MRTTVNVDNPENGLEALAQVVSCEEIIGWRSRDATGPERGLTRVVLFLTDDQFHYAGEGRVSEIGAYSLLGAGSTLVPGTRC